MISNFELAIEDAADLGPSHPGLALEETAFGDLEGFAVGQVGFHGTFHYQCLTGGDLPGQLPVYI